LPFSVLAHAAIEQPLAQAPHVSLVTIIVHHEHVRRWLALVLVLRRAIK
jgi:hypothetical protein